MWRSSYLTGGLKDNQRKTDEHFRAIDGGGPTRQFLSMFWRYLPKITATNKNYGEYSLFEETDNYLRPLCDNKIIYTLMEDDYKLEETAICRIYRAFGRIVGFCLLHGYHIYHNVLSKIHRNYLFRGISPKESCDISDLLFDLKDSMGQQGIADEKFLDDLRESIDCKSLTETDFERQLRDHVFEVYIEQNMIFLEAVKEGMRLGTCGSFLVQRNRFGELTLLSN